MGETLREMPKYKCHKIVHALKIAKIDYEYVTIEKEKRRDVKGAKLYPEDSEKFAPFDVDAEFVRKHLVSHETKEVMVLKKGDGYYVVYDDDYKSWSPIEAFEGGYTLLEDLDMAGLDHNNWTKDCQGVFLKVNDTNIVQCNKCGMTINELLAQIRIDKKKRK